MDKLKMKTTDLTDKNIERIASLFPNVITETRDDSGVVKKAVDFDLLKQALSKNLVEGDDERYRLDWPGKKASLLKANIPITKTLRPCREESVNFDTTENVYIEGDNFEVLKILQESYLGKLKMIYIDPPYNTGNDFIYKDDFAKSKDEYEEDLGVEDEEGGKLFRNTDSNGRFHSDWISMMYERLVVAKDLLKDDGVIFISIDDGELDNLKKICSEVFGESNVETVIWQKVSDDSGKLKVTYRMRLEHEYVVVCFKNKVNNYFNKFIEKRNYKNEYTNPDNDPRGPYKQAIISDTEENSNNDSNRYYGVTTPSGKIYTRQWRVEKWEMDELITNNRIFFGISGDSIPSLKAFISEPKLSTPSTLMVNLGTAKTAGTSIEKIFNDRSIFLYPKPVELIKHLIKIVTDNRYSLNPSKKSKRKVFFAGVDMGIEDAQSNDIILDFFSGSATTAHAVMQLNVEDGGNRKFIMVQLPEKTDEESEAYKAGYKTIAEIGRERIRRAGKKIVEELKAKNQQLQLGEDPVNASKLDVGFRVYKTDDTNMKDVFYHPAGLKQEELFKLESNIKEDRTPEDLLTQVILDLGLELSLPVETKKMLKNTVFIVQTNALVACFDNDIDFKIVNSIADLKPFKVVFKDASFKDDKDRINVEERFKRLSPETKVAVI